MKEPEKNSSDFFETLLCRILSPFTTVHAGELGTLFLLTLNIYLLLTAYYILKPVREALILAGHGAEIKSYLSGAQVILLIGVVKAFSWLSSRVRRCGLISSVTLFFSSNLLIFYFFARYKIFSDVMGIIFFVWVGIFSVTVVAQFWGFANDIYGCGQGKRLFPVLVFGASLGAISGGKIAGWLIKFTGLYEMMLVAGGILVLSIFLTLIIHKRDIVSVDETKLQHLQKPLEKEGGFHLLFQSRYLIYIAFMVAIINIVNTTGEYILGKSVTTAAQSICDSGTGTCQKEQFIGGFYADFFFYVSLLQMLIQIFLVSRIFKYLGIGKALFLAPLISLGGYSFIVLSASLASIKWPKIMENAVNYSITNTTGHALFLITPRQIKYKVKSAVDTFFYRAGDVLSAVIVFGCTTFANFGIWDFARLNLVLVFVWLFISYLTAREYKLRSTYEQELH